MFPLIVLLAFAPPPGAAEVEGERWRRLTQEAEPPRDELPPPFAASRDVVLTPVEGGIQVEARWRVRAMQPGWFSGTLLGSDVEAHVERVTWNGKPAAFSSAREGSVVFGHATGDAIVVLRAFVPGEPTRGEVRIDLLPAVVGEVRVTGVGKLRARVRDRTEGAQLIRQRGRFSTGGSSLALELVDPATGSSAATRPDLVVARVGLGLTVGEAELRGRAHVVWEVRHGTLERVSLSASGLGDDLQVEGPNVRAWTRSGDRVEVELQQPSHDRVDLQLRWSAIVPAGTESSLALPRLEPHDAFRTESSVQLARDGEIEVIPELAGWQPLAAAQLPEWGEGLVEGTPTASFAVAGPAEGTLGLFRFVPVEAPPLVVDVAAYQVATSREGRTLMRAHYEIRNERSAALRVQPPAGTRIIGARVGGEPALPGRDREGAWLIPLRRSVETVAGSLSFPVEVILMGDSEDWSRRDRRRLRLPTVDAPVAASRVTLYLPPGYTSLLDPGDGDVVPAFTEGGGITYGLGVGEVGSGRADLLFQQAVDAWLDNDFEDAQHRLDELREIGASNENMEKLQANLQVVRGESTGKKVDVTLERRIKEQAKARAVDEVQEERRARQRADELDKAGDYVAAEQEYRRALDMGRRLEMLEQSESVEQQTKNVAYESKLAELEQDAERQKQEIASTRARFREADAKEGKRKAKKDEPPARASASFGKGKDTLAVSTSEDDSTTAPTSGTAGLETKPNSRDYTAVIEDPTDARADVDEDGAEGTGTGYILEGANAVPEEEISVEAKMDVYAAPGVSGGRVRAVMDRARARRGVRHSDRGGIGLAKKAKPVQTLATKTALPASPAPPPPPPADEPAKDPLAGETEIERAPQAGPELARLPDPAAHATAMSVTIPTAGEAVLYQRLLLAAGATYEVEIEAREPLRERKYR